MTTPTTTTTIKPKLKMSQVATHRLNAAFAEYKSTFVHLNLAALGKVRAQRWEARCGKGAFETTPHALYEGGGDGELQRSLELRAERKELRAAMEERRRSSTLREAQRVRAALSARGVRSRGT